MSLLANGFLSTAGAPGCDDAYRGVCSWLDERDATGTLARLLQYVLVPVLVFVVLIILGRIVRGLIDRAGSDLNRDPQIRTLVHNVITVATWMIAFFAGFVKAGLSLNVLLTFGGVTTLAIGLAFQDLLRNVLAGVFLLVERPIRIGDLVTISDQTGTVETIALRTTAMRTLDGRLAILPNIAAFNGVILNDSAFDVRLYTVSATLPTGSSLEELMTRFTQELRRIPELARHPEPRVVPSIAADVTTLECRYAIDFRTHDADAINARVAQRVHAALQGQPLPEAPPELAEASAPETPAGETGIGAIIPALRARRRRGQPQA